MNELTKNWLTEFQDKETRHIYADNFLNTWIATQLKVLREDKGWTQAELADETGMKQERISVLEDVNYESWTIKTLKRFAKAFDVRLSIKFETFGSYLSDFDSFKRENLSRVCFDRDPAFHPELAQAAQVNRQVFLTTETGKFTALIKAVKLWKKVQTVGSQDRPPIQIKFEFMQPTSTQGQIVSFRDFQRSSENFIKKNVESEKIVA
jgi:transcriptional regulator with XRE-family HTH domain